MAKLPYNRPAALKALHAVGRNLGFDHDALRDLAATFFHIPAAKVSLGKLTNDQLSRFISHLRGHKTGAPVSIPNKASDKQLWKIRQLAFQLGMLQEDEQNSDRLAGFIRRQCGKERLSVLTIRDAQLVIDGLKNMVERATPSDQPGE